MNSAQHRVVHEAYSERGRRLQTLLISHALNKKHLFENTRQLALRISEHMVAFEGHSKTLIFFFEQIFAGNVSCSRDFWNVIMVVCAKQSVPFPPKECEALNVLRGESKFHEEGFDSILDDQLQAKEIILVESKIVGSVGHPMHGIVNGVMIAGMMERECVYRIVIDESRPSDLVRHLSAIEESMYQYWIDCKGKSESALFIREQLHSLIEHQLKFRFLPASMCLIPTVTFIPNDPYWTSVYAADFSWNHDTTVRNEIAKMSEVVQKKWLRDVYPLLSQSPAPDQLKRIHDTISQIQP